MPPPVRTAQQLAVLAASDTQVADEIKADPVAAIAKYAAPLENDVWIYRMVVGALGLAVLIALVGAIALSVSGKTVPDVLTALGSAAVGALAGLLAPSPMARS